MGSDGKLYLYFQDADQRGMLITAKDEVKVHSYKRRRLDFYGSLSGFPFFNRQSEKSIGLNIFTYSIVTSTHKMVEKSNESNAHESALKILNSIQMKRIG